MKWRLRAESRLKDFVKLTIIEVSLYPGRVGNDDLQPRHIVMPWSGFYSGLSMCRSSQHLESVGWYEMDYGTPCWNYLAMNSNMFCRFPAR